MLLDRGYHHPKVVVEHTLKGVSVVLRLSPHAMPLRRPGNDDKLDLYELLKHTSSDTLTVPVELAAKGQATAKGWIYCRRLPPARREEARRKCRASSKSGAPKPSTLLFAEWLLIFTTVPPEVLDAHTVCALYSLRWRLSDSRACSTLISYAARKAPYSTPCGYTASCYSHLIDQALAPTVWCRTTSALSAT